MPALLRTHLALGCLCLACFVFSITAQDDLPDAEALISAGGIVELPAGDFKITRSMTPPNYRGLVLRGAGPKRTRLILANDLVDDQGKPQPMIRLAGVLQKNGVISGFQWWEISNLTILGEGHTADALRIQAASMGRMDRVEIRDFKGSAVVGQRWWDTAIIDCHFVKCGDVQGERPAMWLMTGNPVSEDCNNLSFIACRWENNPWVSLIVGKGARVNRFVSCKWHGPLDKPLDPFEHVRLVEAEDNIFTACNFTNCGGSAVVQIRCKDNSFEASHIGNSRRYGIEFHETRGSTEGVTWSREGGKNYLGNVFPPNREKK